MYKELDTKLTNVLKAEAEYIRKNENDKYEALEKMNDIYKLSKILENFEELTPILDEYFEKKAKKLKFGKSMEEK